MPSNYIITENGELMHYGVKGMRWGVRRYQNKDVSLTPSGKKKLKRLKSVAKPRPDGLMETREMLGYHKNKKHTKKLAKIMTRDDLADWLENNDARLRDKYDSGELTFAEFEREFYRIMEKADRRRKQINRKKG